MLTLAIALAGYVAPVAAYAYATHKHLSRLAKITPYEINQ